MKIAQNGLKMGPKSEFWIKKDPKFKKKIPKKFWRFWPGFDINLTRDEFLVKNGSIIGKNRGFSLKNDAEARI